MKKLIVVSLVLLAIAGSVSAQKITGSPGTLVGGDMNASSAACATARSCVWATLSPNASSLSVTLSGTWSATILAEQSADGGTTWTTVAASLANGLTTYTVTSMTDFRVRMSAFTSGIASVTLSVGLLQVQSVVAGGSSSSTSSPGPSSDFRLGISLYDDFMGGSPGAPNGSGTIAYSGHAGTFGSTAPGLTGSAAIAIAAGETVIVSVTSAKGATICGLGGVQDSGQGLSDDGGNTYVLLAGPTAAGTSGANATCMEIWGTFPPSQAKAATTITITTPNISSSIAAASYTGVKAYGQVVAIAGANSASATGSVTTQDANNFVACGFGWFNGAADTYTATAGTARANVAGAVATFGAVLTDNTVASAGALANSGTLSGSTIWSGMCVELRTVQPMTVTSGNIGQLAWASSGIGNTNQVPSVPVPGSAGVLQLQTGATSGNNANIYLPNNGVNTFPVNDVAFDFIARVQIPIGHTTTTSLFCGLQVNPPYTPGESSSDFVGFGYDTTQSDTGWNFITKMLYGTAARGSSGNAIDNQWHDLRIRSITPGVILFSMDGGTETASTVAISYTPMAISCNATTRTSATRFLNIDFIQFKEYTIR